MSNAPHTCTPYCTCPACCAKRRDDRRRLLRSDIRDALTRGACVGFDSVRKVYVYSKAPADVLTALTYSMRCNLRRPSCILRDGINRNQRLALRVMRAAGHAMPWSDAPGQAATLAKIMG